MAEQRSAGLVVVGVDGSEGSRRALVAALRAAAAHGADLDVVAAYTIPPAWTAGEPVVIPDVAPFEDDLRRQGEDLLAAARRDPGLSNTDADSVATSVAVVSGPAGGVLVERSRDADLLVVGSRGRSAVRIALLGSVALHCATHAACPVLVVHAGPSLPDAPTRVVVGVDGSEDSRHALRTGIAEAVRMGASVEVVAAYAVEDAWTDMWSVLLPTEDDVRTAVLRRAQQMVDEVAAEWVDEAELPHVRVVAARGGAQEVLVERARGAALLVVGCRGHGEVRGLVLGSVALHCALLAPCPVLIVHAHPDGQRPDAADVVSELALQ